MTPPIPELIAARPLPKHCGFWKGHDWSKWKELIRGDIQRTSDKSCIGIFLIQERQCDCCGLKEIKRDDIW